MSADPLARLVRFSKSAIVAALAIVGATAVLLTAVSLPITLVFATLSAVFVLSAARSLLRDERRGFILATGLLLVGDSIATGLVALPVFVPYLCFGAGLAALVVGNSVMRLGAVTGPAVKRDATGDAFFLRSARAALLKGLGFVAAVMAASFFFLLVSLSATLSEFPLTFLAILVIVIIVSLTILVANHSAPA